MMWDGVPARLALLELYATGTLRRRQAQAEAFAALAELPWTRATRRRGELRLVEEHRAQLATLLTRCWPAWTEVQADLEARGLPMTIEGLQRRADALRAAAMPPMPARINRRTAASLVAPHAKAALTPRRRQALQGSEATGDGIVRLRPHGPVRVRTTTGTCDLDLLARVLGEVAIPERAFRDGLALDGSLQAVLLVENLGAWRDLPPLPGWLYAHVPGWDTSTAVHLLACCPGVPALHFGDLDPNGVRIVRHLQGHRPDLRWCVPSFWSEYLGSHGQGCAWPPGVVGPADPPLLHELVRQGRWLEQEPLVLDSRLPAALLTLREAPPVA